MNIYLTAKLKKFDSFVEMYNEKVNEYDEKGKSILFYALSNNDPGARYSITNFLLDKGMNPKVLNEENENLLHILFSRTIQDKEQTFELFKRLVDAGVDVSQLDSKNQQPLQYIINSKYTDEELKPIYEIVFRCSTLRLDVKNAWGYSVIDLAEKLPYRKNVLEKMNNYDKE